MTPEIQELPFDQLRILHREDEPLCDVKVAASDRERFRVARKRMQSENGAGDDAERAVGAGNELWQVVPRDVLDDSSAARSKRAIRESDGHADDEIAKRTETKPKSAGVAARERAADGGVLGPQKIGCQALIVVGKRGLQSADGAAGFDRNGKVGPNMLDDFVEARRGKNDLGARGRVAPAELCPAPARDDRKAGIIGEPERAGKFDFVAGLENKARLYPANGIRGTGSADGIRRQDGAEFIFDVRRSQRHGLTLSVHYNHNRASS